MSLWLRNHVNSLRELNNLADGSHNAEIMKIYAIIKNEIDTHSCEDVDRIILNDFVSVSVKLCKVAPTDVQSTIVTTWTSLVMKLKRMDTEFVKVVYGEMKLNLEDTLLPLYKILITADSLDLNKLLMEANQTHHAEIAKCVMCISEQVPVKVFANFVASQVVHVIYVTTDDNIRKLLMNHMLQFNDKFSPACLSPAQQKEVLNMFRTSFIRNMELLRHKSNLIWYQMCIFLIRYCGKLLHSSIDLMNDLLRNIECGFKTKNIEDRLLSYECWKVVINNCALNREYICSNKQIKLLIKPLSVKFSNRDDVTKKRLEVWVLLLDKLQESCTKCLREFVTACYGPFNSEIVKPLPFNKITEALTINKTYILIKLLGHSCQVGNCLQGDFSLKAPVININNFIFFNDFIIDAVGVCTERLVWQKECTVKTAIECLWKSLFTIIFGTEDKLKEDYCKKVFVQLDKLIKVHVTFNNDISLLGYILQTISTFIDVKHDKLVMYLNIKYPLVSSAISSSCPNPNFIKMFASFVESNGICEKLENFKTIYDILKSNKHARNSCRLALEVWLLAAKGLLVSCQDSDNKLNNLELRGFMIWVMEFLYPCEIENTILEVWKRLFLQLCGKIKDDVLENCNLLVKTSPQVICNIVAVLPTLALLIDKAEVANSYVHTWTSLTSLCLKHPCLPKEKVTLLVESFVRCLAFKSHDSIMEVLVNCIEKLLCSYQVYDILLHLKTYLFQAQDIITQKFLPLRNTIKKEMPNMDKDALAAAAAIITLLERAQPSTAQNSPSETSSKTYTVKLVNSTPTNDEDSMKIIGILKNVKIFGLNAGGTSPAVNIKENYLKTTTTPSRSTSRTNTPVRHIKSTNSVPKFNPVKHVDDDSATFVYIESNIDINKINLTEHQKEVFKKHRDIPALYQDLTRSQSSNNTQNVFENRTLNDESVAIFNRIENKLKDIDVAVPGGAVSAVSVDKFDEKNKSVENLEGTVPNNDTMNINVSSKEKIVQDTRKESDKIDVKSCVGDRCTRNKDSKSTVSFENVLNCENNLHEKQSKEVHKTGDIVLASCKSPEVPERAKRGRKAKSIDDGEIVADSKRKRRRLSLLNTSVKENTVTKSTPLKTTSSDMTRSVQEVKHVGGRSSKNLPRNPPENITSPNAKKTKKSFKIVPSPTFDNPNCPKKITVRISISNEENSMDSPTNQVVAEDSILERTLSKHDAKDDDRNLQNQHIKPKECDKSGNSNIKKERNKIEKATSDDVAAKAKSLQNEDVVESHSNQSFDDILQKKLSLVDDVKESLNNKKIIKALKQIQMDIANPDEYIKQSTRLRRRSELCCYPATPPEQSNNGKHCHLNSDDRRKSNIPKVNTTPRKRGSKSRANAEDNIVSDRDSSKTHSTLKIVDTNDVKPDTLSKHNEKMEVKNEGVLVPEHNKKGKRKGRRKSRPKKKIEKTSKSSTDEHNTTDQVNIDDTDETLSFSAQVPVNSSSKLNGTEITKDKENSREGESTTDHQNSFLAGERSNKLNTSSDTDTCNPDEPIYFPQLSRNGFIGYSTSKSDLPSSPTCDSTPVKIKEFFTNTIDISPINKEQVCSKHCVDISSDKVIHREKYEPNMNKPECAVTVEKQSNSEENKVKPLFISNLPKSRSAKLLKLIPNVSITPKTCNSDVCTFPKRMIATCAASHSGDFSSGTTSLQTLSTSRTPFANISIVPTERTQKMMKQYKMKQVEEEARNKVNNGSDILEFSREVPSAAVLPTSGILKRKACDSLEKGISPFPKRKRVNFTEPPMTSSKIYFKTSDEEENEVDNKTRPRKNKSTGKLKTSLRKLNVRVSKLNSAASAKRGCSSIASFNVAKASPIYPELIDCNENIQEVLSIIHRNDLLENFHLIHVKTVGDLAKLNTDQVNKLEFLDEPKLEPIVAALDVISAKLNSSLVEADVSFLQPTNGDDQTKFYTNLHKAITEVNLKNAKSKENVKEVDGNISHVDQANTIAATNVIHLDKLPSISAVDSEITISEKDDDTDDDVVLINNDTCSKMCVNKVHEFLIQFITSSFPPEGIRCIYNKLGDFIQ